jgi:hypothetical protein
MGLARLDDPLRTFGIERDSWDNCSPVAFTLWKGMSADLSRLVIVEVHSAGSLSEFPPRDGWKFFLQVKRERGFLVT